MYVHPYIIHTLYVHSTYIVRTLYGWMYLVIILGSFQHIFHRLPLIREIYRLLLVLPF